MTKWLVVLCLLSSAWAGAVSVTSSYVNAFGNTDICITFHLTTPPYNPNWDTLCVGKLGSAAARTILYFDTTNSANLGYDLRDTLGWADSVTACTLSLVVGAIRGTPDTMYIEPILRMPTREDSINWTIYKNGGNWSTAGCGNDGADYSSTYRVKSVTATSGTWKIDVTSIVQAVVNGGIPRLLGFRIKCKTEVTDTRAVYYASEYTGTGSDPAFKATYWFSDFKKTIHGKQSRNGKHTRHGK